jgi:hypothetical protein
MSMGATNVPAPGVPEQMTVAAARFFASDWESTSFIEFFIDLQLRVSEDAQASLGRTLARLKDHGRFALQMTFLRSVDSYFSYLGEVDAAVESSRLVKPLMGLSQESGSIRKGVPIDAGDQFFPALSHGNVRQLSRLFFAATSVELLTDEADIARLTRMISIRNLIAHGRTFASDELVPLLDETVSVGGLGLRWKDIRGDLDYLRSSVVRIDNEVSERWQLERPIAQASLFAAIAAAAKLEPGENLSGGDSAPKHLKS